MAMTNPKQFRCSLVRRPLLQAEIERERAKRKKSQEKKGEEMSPDKKKYINHCVPENLHRATKAKAAGNGLFLGEVLIALVAFYVAEEGADSLIGKYLRRRSDRSPGFS